MRLTPSDVLQYLQDRRISIWAIAARLEVDNGHLTRVLGGRREGSQALLESVIQIADSIPEKPQCRQEDAARLIDAATHIFFLNRGIYDSAICRHRERTNPVARRPAGGVPIRNASRSKRARELKNNTGHQP